MIIEDLGLDIYYYLYRLNISFKEYFTVVLKDFI